NRALGGPNEQAERYAEWFLFGPGRHEIQFHAGSDCRADRYRNGVGAAIPMKPIISLAAFAALFVLGCEPKLELELERRGEAYKFELHREDDKRGFGAESFDVMEGQSVVCEIRHAPGPGPKVSRWTYGSR